MKYILTILFVSSILIAQSGGELKAQNIADDIIKLYIAGDYQKVIEIIKSKNPDELTATEWFYLGLSYSQIKSIKEAVNAFEHCVKLDSANTGYRLNYSRVLSQMGRTGDAVNSYNAIIEKDSSNIAALYDLGLIYINRKDFMSARPMFEKLSDYNQTDFLSAYYLALSSYHTSVTHDDTLKVNDLIFRAKLLNFEYMPTFELSGAYELNRNNFERAYFDYSLLSYNM